METESQIGLVIPERAKKKITSRLLCSLQIAAVLIFGAAAVTLLLVANGIFNKNDSRYEACYAGILGSPIENDGCEGAKPYACVRPQLPVKLASIAGVLVLFSVILGIDWNCAGWCCCFYADRWWAHESGLSFCGTASLFLFLQLGSASWFALISAFWVVLGKYLTDPEYSSLGTGLCCCYYHSNGGRFAGAPGIMAAAAAAGTVFGACHLVAARLAYERWAKHAS